MSDTPITGWKSIAQHLGVSEITAKRWRGAGLPIHKPAGRSVLAFADELNAWIRQDLRAAPSAEDSRPTPATVQR